MYFNEFDPFAAQWLGKLFPTSTVDKRSIKDVTAEDLIQFDRCHFFGGIGGWELALRLAGWPEDWPVWTGSCPCQPYSAAGKQKGQADDRHLWPQMFRLIRECRPPIIFGEQVEAAIRFGWLDGVFADLESEGYACGAVVLGAHSVGAPHLRQRIYWVADSRSSERARRFAGNDRSGISLHSTDRCCVGGLANATSDGRPKQRRESGQRGKAGPSHAAECPGPVRVPDCGLGESFQSRLEGLTGDGDCRSQSGRIAAESDGPVAATGLVGGPAGSVFGLLPGVDHGGTGESGAAVSGLRPAFWSNYDLIPCRDGKSRRVESGTFPLAHGVPNRVGRLRGYGNAIVPQVAAAFIRAFLESTNS